MLHVETALIKQALNEHAQNVTAAAKQLGISRATLYRKIKHLNYSVSKL
jgi:transcriptional regulator with PAS, ATPase and Fis domain